MKLLVILSLMMHLVFSAFPQTSNLTNQIERECPQQTSLKVILGQRRLYFTMPTSDPNPQLKLWYADSTGTYRSPITLTSRDILETSPNGSFIVVVRRDAEGFVPRDQAYDFFGSPLREMFLIDSSDFSIKALNFPEELVGMRFNRIIHWSDDETIQMMALDMNNMVTIWAFNVFTNQSDIRGFTLQEANFSTGTANLMRSPDGTHLFYTTFPSIHLEQAEYSDEIQYLEPALSWRIVDYKGETVLDYITGIGGTAHWLPDSSGIVIRDINLDLIKIGLDGEIVKLVDRDQGDFANALPDHLARRIAFTALSTQNEQPNIVNDTLLIFDSNSGKLTDYCHSASIKKELWSSDDTLLAYIVRTDEQTEIFVLNVETNQFTTLLPYQPQNASIGHAFVRVVGWQN